MDILDQQEDTVDDDSTAVGDISYPFASVSEKDYLKSLDISDLVMYLEVQPKSANFKKVDKILLSREKKMTKHANNLEKKLEMYKGKCSELSIALEEINKKCTAMENMIEEFGDYKMICSKLEEKANRFDEDCKIISEREQKALQIVTKLSADHEEFSRITNAELVELKMENKDLKSAKQQTEEEIENQKKRCGELEKMLGHANELEKNLEMYKTSCSELSATLEVEKKKSFEMEGKLEEYKGYKMTCKVLEEKVVSLEEDCKSVTESEKKAIQNITKLSIDLENVRCSSKKELVELETKNKDLECVRQSVVNEIEAQKKKYQELRTRLKHAEQMEKNLETYKARCSELSIRLEEKKKVNIALEIKLAELKGCKKLCEELKEKVTRLEEDSKLRSEREKSAMEKISNLSADLEKLNEELNDVKTKNKDLECAKQTSEDEIKSQKKKCEEMEKMTKNAIELEKDLEIYKVKCSELAITLDEKKKKSIALEGKLEEFKECKKFCHELKEKVTCLEEDCKLVSEREKIALERVTILSGVLDKPSEDKTKDIDELETKIKDLESAKRKADDGIKIHKKRYKELKSRATKLESGILALLCEAQISEKAKVEVGTEVSKKKRKTNESKSGKIRSEMIGGVNSACSSKLKVKLKTVSNKCDEKVPESTGTDSVCHSAVKVCGGGQVEGTADKYSSTLKRKWTPETAIEKSRSPSTEIVKENAKMDKRQSGKWTPEIVIEKSGTPSTEIAKENGKMDKMQLGKLTPETVIEKSGNPSSEIAKENEQTDKRQMGKLTPETEKSGNPSTETAKENGKMDKRQSERNRHPPNRLNL